MDIRKNNCRILYGMLVADLEVWLRGPPPNPDATLFPKNGSYLANSGGVNPPNPLGRIRYICTTL